MTEDPVELELPWQALTARSDTYTCYSAALATWAAFDSAEWPATIDAGLYLAVVERSDLLFGFAHFPATLARDLGVVRRSADEVADAVAGVEDELAAAGRVIVAGDGFNLPWHVAHGSRHVPHWFVLARRRDGTCVVADPFTCRNELGVQQTALMPVAGSDLPTLLATIPPDDAVTALREAFALGADDGPLPPARFRWLVRGDPPEPRPPLGPEGPAAIARLAAHFREHTEDPAAYRQGDDLWSVARHRAFSAARLTTETAVGGSESLGRWCEEHARPIAARWGHVAPLLMQATLTLASGRVPTSSLADTLDELATREEQAAEALSALA
jgi:hypothetical protein